MRPISWTPVAISWAEWHERAQADQLHQNKGGPVVPPSHLCDLKQRGKIRYDLEMPSFMLGVSHSTQIICILIYCSGVSFFNLTAKHTQKVKNSFSCQIYHSVLVFLNPSNYVFAPFLIPLLFSHCLIHSLFHLASSAHPRAGNSLIRFRCESLVFYPKMSKWAIR